MKRLHVRLRPQVPHQHPAPVVPDPIAGLRDERDQAEARAIVAEEELAAAAKELIAVAEVKAALAGDLAESNRLLLVERAHSGNVFDELVAVTAQRDALRARAGSDEAVHARREADQHRRNCLVFQDEIERQRRYIENLRAELREARALNEAWGDGVTA